MFNNRYGLNDIPICENLSKQLCTYIILTSTALNFIVNCDTSLEQLSLLFLSPYMLVHIYTKHKHEWDKNTKVQENNSVNTNNVHDNKVLH